MAVSEYKEKISLYSPDDTKSDEEIDDNSDNGFPRPVLRRQWEIRRRLIMTVIFLGVSGISLLGAFIMGASLAGKARQAEVRAYSPASEALIPSTRVFEHDSRYMGTPSPDLDGAWSTLLQYSNLRFSESEMDAIDPQRKYLSAVKLPDGGYFGMLNVYHELHCIKRLRRSLYADYYTPDVVLTPQQSDDQRWHLEHCLDAIRQGIMCRADVMPRTMRWIQTEPVPGANSSSPHSCYSWDAVDNWARSRSIDNIFEKGYLKHPTFGDVYSWDGLEELLRVGIGHEHSK